MARHKLPIAPREPEAPAAAGARPSAARVFGHGERSSLFGGAYRAPAAGERGGRRLGAVFDKLGEGEPGDRGSGEPPPRRY